MSEKKAPGAFVGRTFAESINDAVVLLDTNAKIEWWNHSARTVLGLNAKHHGKSITSVLPSVSLQEYIRQHERGNIECPSPVTPDRMLSLILIPYESDQYLLVAQDVSHLHHVDRMRRDFVANVSHELRTPLTVMRGYLELLLQQADDLPSMWQQTFPEMMAQTTRMEHLVEDLLLLSRLEHQDVKPEECVEVNVPELLAAIAGEASAVSNGRHHFVMNIDKSLRIRGVENELRSVFSNIVINAVRYSPDGGKITIDWYHDAQGAHFSVADEGIGIAEEDVPRITERFYRVDKGRSRSSGGTGLGLSIVKHVLLRHDASLFIRSKPGKGSQFRCDFKLL